MSVKPFIKWVGGKSQLLEEIEVLSSGNLSVEDLTYVESFVGGGAVLFWVLKTFPDIKKAVINDVNKDLIITYRVIRDCPENLISRLEVLETEFHSLTTDEERTNYFYEKRDRFNTKTLEDLENASLFIFLNKTCFNGLYRVNRKGLFNVPFGKYKTPLICDRETILDDSKLLQKVEILNGDFEETIKKVETKNAFFYFDPPYRPLNETSSFTTYSNDGFNDDEQKRLKKYCDQVVSMGFNFVLSNSDPTNTKPDDLFFDDLYKGYEIKRVKATRNINSIASKRGSINELLISNK